MKGWKTIVIFAAIAAAGWFEQLASKLEACKVEPKAIAEAIAPQADVVALCNVGFPGWVVGVIGFVGIALRFITTTHVFKTWGAK